MGIYIKNVKLLKKGTNPLSKDSDSDTLEDAPGGEWWDKNNNNVRDPGEIYATNPARADTDYDGSNDDVVKRFTGFETKSQND